MICARADQTTHLRRERGRAQAREVGWLVSLRVMLKVLIRFALRAGPGDDRPLGTFGIKRELLTSLTFRAGPGDDRPHETAKYTTGGATGTEHRISIGPRSFVRTLVLNTVVCRNKFKRKLLHSFAFHAGAKSGKETRRQKTARYTRAWR